MVNPPRWHSRYAAATLVRRALEGAAAKHLAGGPAGRTLVDFGCGSMPYRAIFGPHVGQYLGVDLAGNQEAAFELRPDGSSLVPTGFADVLLSTQVLEHVPEPVEYLAEARRMMKAGGLMMLSTHGYWLYHPDPTDFHRWTGAGLERLVSGAGFEVVELVGIMGLLPAGLQLASDGLVRRLLPKGMRRWVGPGFALMTQTPILWMDRLHTDEQRRQDAAAFLIVARKC